jgi:hypothetical protein
MRTGTEVVTCEAAENLSMVFIIDVYRFSLAGAANGEFISRLTKQSESARLQKGQ